MAAAVVNNLKKYPSILLCKNIEGKSKDLDGGVKKRLGIKNAWVRGNSLIVIFCFYINSKFHLTLINLSAIIRFASSLSG
jgi:hypothetical protein